MAEYLVAEMSSHYEVRASCGPERRRSDASTAGPNIAAIVGHDPIDDALLDLCPAAKLICTFAAGTDNVDLTRCQRDGRAVCNTPAASAGEVADSAVMLVLAATRRLLDLDRLVRSGNWLHTDPPPPHRGLEGAHIGVVGAGAIGQAILCRLAGFPVELHYHSRRRRDLDVRYHSDIFDLARSCDVMILALPGGTETRHLVDARILAALGPEGILVNVARGSIVAEADLVAALSAGTLGFAALDVFENEPFVPEALRILPNTLFMPHSAGASLQARRRKADMLMATLESYFAGREIPHRVI